MSKTNSSINLNKVDKMCLLSFQNSINLHIDSIHLFEIDSFGSSFYLSCISAEELGKFFILSDFLYHTRTTGRYNDNKDEEIIKIFGKDVEEGYFRKLVYNHIAKQKKIAEMTWSLFSISSKYFDNIFEGDLELQKQNSLYVGLQRIGKKINLKSKINNPNTFNKNSTKSQITRMHQLFLELIISLAKEQWITDSHMTDDFINLELYDDLKSMWQIKNRKLLSRLTLLENYNVKN